MMTVPYQPKTARDLLIDLGVGQYNATMLIETLFMAPATTEAASAPVMLLIGHLQEALNSMGCNLVVTGTINEPTAQALAAVAGPGFLDLSWFKVVRDVVAARKSGHQIKRWVPRPNTAAPVGAFDLPDVPGGMLTYAAGGLLLWHLLSKKTKRTSP
jgi:hypothetical protein